MNQQELENRITNLEAIVSELQKQIGKPAADEKPWWEKISGTFANDPDYDEAMRLGREYRKNTKIEDEFDEK